MLHVMQTPRPPVAVGTTTVSRRGPAAWITLNRPDKLNAISAEMVVELQAVMDEVEADPTVRVVVLRGAGSSFCAGFDLAEMSGDTDVDLMRSSLTADLELIMRFWRCPKPTLAAVHGYVLGGGLELALACDVTIATDDAVFGEPEPTFGSGIVALLLPWLTGSKAAREMLLFGSDRISADRAQSLGLVNEVVSREQLEDAATGMARRSALLDPTAVRLTKRALNATYDRMGMEDALLSALETDVEIETTRTEEGLAFLAVLDRDGVAAALDWRAERLGLDAQPPPGGAAEDAP